MDSSKLGKYEVLFPNRREYHFLKREIFSQGIYHFNCNTQSPFIIDIGAHIGISTLYFKYIYPNCKLLCFEPNRNSFDILNQNILINGLKDITTINKAISTYIGNTFLYVDSKESGWDSNSSLIEGSWNGNESTKKVEIECTTLHPYLNVKYIDMLKIDTEGYELNILKSHRDILRIVRNISIEYHPRSKGILKQILKILNPHFEIHLLKEGKEIKRECENSLLTIQGKKVM